MTLFRAIPAWAWFLLLIAGALAVQEYRVRAAVEASNAAREAQFRAAIGAIQAAREEQERAAVALAGERARLKADLVAHATRVAELERQSEAARATVVQVTEAGAHLVASGSLDEVLAALTAQGLAPRLAPRPRP